MSKHQVSIFLIRFEDLAFTLFMLRKYDLTIENFKLQKGVVLAEPPDTIRCHFDVYGESDDFEKYRKDCNRGVGSELYEDILDHIFNRSFKRESAISLLEYFGREAHHD